MKKAIVLVLLLLVSCSNEPEEKVGNDIVVDLSEILTESAQEEVEEVEEAKQEESSKEPVEEKEEIAQERVSLKKVRILIAALNARNDSTVKSDVIGRVLFNEVYDVLAYSPYKDWYQIQLESGDLAWISGWYCSDIVLEEGADTNKKENMRLELLDGAYRYDQKSKDSESDLLLEKGQQLIFTSVTIDDDGTKWYEILLGQDKFYVIGNDHVEVLIP